ncbi:MAG: hypothetical protein KC917_13305 [Candidatus Omnitrophica bacterium]|nr:hypothetical protein [Candidatus Omnitrophota bacterium]
MPLPRLGKRGSADVHSTKPVTDTNPPDSLIWLNSLTNFERKLPKKYETTEFNTDRYRALLENLGNPHLTEIPTVQILGTDGKGSTLALLEALLNRAGHSTKSFISPHLVRVEERFRLDGDSIETEELVGCLDRVHEASAELEGLTYFEALNAAFWVWVEINRPDFVLLETGLGGRLDTTTICNAKLKILTYLERDHFKILGPTMDKIAGEKLAALRSEAPTLICRQSPHLKVQITSFLWDRRIPNDWVEDEIQSTVIDRSQTSWTHRLSGKALPELDVRIPLLGDHQSQNLSAAVLAYQRLVGEWPQSEGMLELNPKWMGRCQILEVGEETWVLDGSHTAMAGQSFRKMLDQLFDVKQPRSFYFISTKERFPWCYLRGLVRPKDELHLVDYSHDRLWSVEELRVKLLEEGWEDYDTPRFDIVTDDEVFTRSGNPGVKILCGSFYWVGEVLGRV